MPIASEVNWPTVLEGSSTVVMVRLDEQAASLHLATLRELAVLSQ